MSNINDFVKNDIINASTDINDLNISPIITDLLEKEIIDCSFMNSSQCPNSCNTGNNLFILYKLYIKLY